MGKESQEARKSVKLYHALSVFTHRTLPQHTPQKDTADVVHSERVLAPDAGLIISTEQSHLAAVWEEEIETSIYLPSSFHPLFTFEIHPMRNLTRSQIGPSGAPIVCVLDQNCTIRHLNRTSRN